MHKVEGLQRPRMGADRLISKSAKELGAQLDAAQPFPPGAPSVRMKSVHMNANGTIIFPDVSHCVIPFVGPRTVNSNL